MNVAELARAIVDKPMDRSNLLAASNYAIFLNRPHEASFGLGLALIVAAVAIDLGQCYGMLMSIVSQASRGSSLIVGAALDAACDALADLVTYRTETLWTVRNKLLDSTLTTPVLAKLVWICQRSAASTSKRERDSLVGEQNHVCHQLGLRPSRSARNHVTGSIYECSVLKFLKEGHLAPDILSVDWSEDVRPSIVLAVNMTYFRGNANRGLEGQIAGAASAAMLPTIGS
eukprot:3651988-Amphidinium_carterae.1